MSIPYWFPQKQIESLRLFSGLHKISEGGIGEIYHAYFNKETPPQEVIIKRLRPGFHQSEIYRGKFLNEAKILKKLSHPQIPAYLEGFQSEKECFFIMQYFKGIDLNKLLIHARHSGIRFSLPFCFEIVLRVLDILEYLHNFSDPEGGGKSLVHCDIKPKNILATSDFKIALIDFSIATFVQPEGKFLGGSIGYMPPEYFTGKAPTPQTDFYSLTVTFHDLLSHRHVLRSKKSPYDIFMELLNREHLKHVQNQNFPKPLEDILLRGLAFETKERFQSAGEFRKALSECAEILKVDLKDPTARALELKNLSVIG